MTLKKSDSLDIQECTYIEDEKKSSEYGEKQGFL
jgi:hypothetical protein